MRHPPRGTIKGVSDLIVAAQWKTALCPNLRFGQALFNLALARWPEKVRPLVGTDCDPFHDNRNIRKFLEALIK